jgi:O-antigen/teichoic acid export membrane protein
MITMFKAIYRSSLFRSAGIYTVSRIINLAIPFLMMPVLTRYLSPADYGIVAMFAVLLGISSPFIGLSLHGAISVMYYKKDGTDLPLYIGNCFIIITASTFLVSIVIWIFAGQISSFSAFPKEWLWAVVIFAATQFIGLVLMTLWQVQNKPVKFAVFQNLQTLMNIGLTIALVVGAGKNWQGRIEAQVISATIFALTAVFILHRNGWLKIKYDKPSIDHALQFGVPLIPHALGGMLIVQTDRMFLTNMVGVAVTGIYTVGYQFGSMIELVASSFNQAYVPWLFKHLAEDNEAMKRKIVVFTYLYFFLILLFALALSAVVPWFLKFFVGKEFIGAGRYVFWIALGYAFSGMYYMVANYIFFVGKTAALAKITFVTALLNICFNYILIKLNGPVGAAQASALAFFISFIFTWILSARVYRMPWNIFESGALRMLLKR